MNKRLAVIALVIGAFVMAPVAEADTLQIQMGGVNYLYIPGGVGVGQLCDGDGCSAAPLVSTFGNADPLDTETYILGGNTLGVFTVANGIGVDFMLPTGQLILGSNPGTGGFLDVYLNSMWAVALDLSSWTVDITSVTGGLSINGSGNVSFIAGQNLPFALTLSQPVVFSFSSTNSAGSLINGFTASGTGEVSGPATVPDPGSSLLLMGLGLVGLRMWRKR